MRYVKKPAVAAIVGALSLPLGAAQAQAPMQGGMPMGGPAMMQGDGAQMAHHGWRRGHGQHGPRGAAHHAARWAEIDKELGVEEVRAIVAGRLAFAGNKRLKVGEVTETDADTVTAEIVTVDDSLVRTVEIDRRTGLPAAIAQRLRERAERHQQRREQP